MTSYSQHGEDRYIFTLLNNGLKLSPLVYELGACNGVNLSNSRALIERGWNAVLVEASPYYTDKLIELYDDNDNVLTIPKAIGAEKGMVNFGFIEDRPDHSGIGKEGIQYEVDCITWNEIKADNIGVLSIDIEGVDTQVLKDAIQSSPELIIIEANTIDDRMSQTKILCDKYVLLKTYFVNSIWLRKDKAENKYLLI